jgi:hypothetical protein
LALIWSKEHAQPAGQRWPYALSLAYGLSLLHHDSMLAFAPGLGLMVLFIERSALWRKWQRTALCLMLVVLPSLVVYPLFLPWVQSRHLSPLSWQPVSVHDWIQWWLGQVMSSDVLTLSTTGTTGLFQRLGIYGHTLLNDYTAVALLGAVVGLICLGRRVWPGLVFVVVTYVLVGSLGANYRGNERQFTYYLPSFVVLIYAYAEGLNALWKAAHRANPKLWRPLAIGSCALVACAVPTGQFLQAYPLRRLDATYGEPLDIWRQTLKTGTMGERLANGLEASP